MPTPRINACPLVWGLFLCYNGKAVNQRAMTSHIYYDEQRQEYIWKLWTGPDGIDYAQGREDSLIGCFQAIAEARSEIAHQYV